MEHEGGKKMGYKIVEKDIENDIGFIHSKVCDTLKEANQHREILIKQLGEEYYGIFVAEEK